MKYIDAVIAWLAKPENEWVNRSFEKHNVTLAELSPTSLSSEFDHAKFDGARVVNGKFCNTVGEYKKECSNHYGVN